MDLDASLTPLVARIDRSATGIHASKALTVGGRHHLVAGRWSVGTHVRSMGLDMLSDHRKATESTLTFGTVISRVTPPQ